MLLREGAWPFGPLFEADWREPPSSLAAALRDRLTGVRTRVFDPDWAGTLENLRLAALPFWPDWTAGEAMLRDGAGVRVTSFLFGPYGVHLMTGAAGLIHDINDRCGVLLDTEARQRAYLHFFTSAVRGDEGPFYLVDADARLQALTGKAPKGKAKGLAAPVRSRLEDGRGLHDAVVFYGQGLYRSTFAVTPDGQVSMEDDEMVTDEQPRTCFIFEGAVRRPAH